MTDDTPLRAQWSRRRGVVSGRSLRLSIRPSPAHETRPATAAIYVSVVHHRFIGEVAIYVSRQMAPIRIRPSRWHNVSHMMGADNSLVFTTDALRWITKDNVCICITGGFNFLFRSIFNKSISHCILPLWGGYTLHTPIADRYV